MSLTWNAAFHGKTISSTPLFSITDIQLEMYSFHVQVKARLFQVSASQAQASSWQWTGFPFASGRVLVTKAELGEQNHTNGLGPLQMRKTVSVPACPILYRHLPLVPRGSVCTDKDGIAVSFHFLPFVGQRPSLFSLRREQQRANNQCLSASYIYKMRKREPRQRRAAHKLIMPSPVK